MLEIEAVKREMYRKDQFVSHIFLVPQKDRGQGPLINFSSWTNLFHTNISRWRGTSVKGNFGKRDYLCKWDLEYHKLSGDDNVTNTGGNRVDIQKVSGCVVNAGNISKGLCKDIDVTIINSIGNSSCPTAYEVPSETDKSTAKCFYISIER